MKQKDIRDEFMTPKKFYKDKFTLVINLRSCEEVDKTGHGKNIVNTQNGILPEIEKTVHAGNIYCNIFVVSDRLINFQNYDLQSIQY